MNSITIAGRVGREPELRHTADGKPVLNFSVADDRGRDKGAQWWRVALFGRRAEALQPHLHKGDNVTIVGRVEQGEYTGKDGHPRTSLDVFVNDIALQGGRPDSPAPARTSPTQPSAAAFDDIANDLPF